MANRWYAKGLEAFGNAGVNWGSDTIKAALVSAGYTPDTAADQFLSAAGANVVGTPVALGSKTNTAGVLDAVDTVFGTVSGDPVTQVVIYKHVTNAGDSPLLMLIDTATGLPVTPNGGDITVAWDAGANKIAAL